jgi:hypothetical protein
VISKCEDVKARDDEQSGDVIACQMARGDGFPGLKKNATYGSCDRFHSL